MVVSFTTPHPTKLWLLKLSGIIHNNTQHPFLFCLVQFLSSSTVSLHTISRKYNKPVPSNAKKYFQKYCTRKYRVDQKHLITQGDIDFGFVIKFIFLTIDELCQDYK